MLEETHRTYYDVWQLISEMIGQLGTDAAKIVSGTFYQYEIKIGYKPENEQPDARLILCIIDIIDHGSNEITYYGTSYSLDDVRRQAQNKLDGINY